MPQGNIREVRYDVPQIPAWRQALSGALQGGLAVGGGMLNRQREAELQKNKNIMQMLPVMAQMGMLETGGVPGQPGAITAPGLPTFQATDAVPDYGERLNQLKGKDLEYEINNRERIRKQKEAARAFQVVIQADPANLKDAWAAYNSVMAGKPPPAPKPVKRKPWWEGGGVIDEPSTAAAPTDETVTIQFNDGKTQNMTREEAKAKGYIK